MLIFTDMFMKKSVFLAIASSLLLFSCTTVDGPDQKDETPDTPVTPVDPEEPEVMSVTEQKEYLEKIGLEFIGMVPASDFKKIYNQMKSTHELYEDYDWDNVEEWAESAYDASLKALDQYTESWVDDYGSFAFKYVQEYNVYESLLLASNFTGRFTAGSGKWTYSKDDNLCFVFKNKKGEECRVELKTSGEVVKVYFGEMSDRTGYHWSYGSYTDTKYEFFDLTQYTIGIPETILITYTEGGDVLVDLEITTKLSDLRGKEFDISKSDLSFTSTLKLNNGYQISGGISYNANEQASVVCALKKDDTSLLTMAFAADISGIPSCNVSAFSSDDFDEDDYNTDNVNGSVKYVKVDVLGKVQVQGTLTNVRKFVEYLEKAADNNKNQANFVSYVNQANGLVDVNLFYDGSDVKQAYVKLEPFSDGRTWDCEPVLWFFDGTSYSTFEAFFNETDFKKFIDAAERLLDDYEKLFD